jgi:hypothetical protein
VKPWWLYRDYTAAAPKDHYRTWAANEPRFIIRQPGDTLTPALRANDQRLTVDFDGTEVDDIWVCKEEAQTAATAVGKIRGVNAQVECNSDSGLRFSPACGCGKGLEWCMRWIQQRPGCDDSRNAGSSRARDALRSCASGTIDVVPSDVARRGAAVF